MTDIPSVPSPERPASPQVVAKAKGEKWPQWLKRTGVGVIMAVILLVLGFIASATVPVMWADAIGRQVHGSLSAGILAGIFYGFVFTFVPVLVGWQAHYRKLKKWPRTNILAIAVILALPNLLTLSILNGGTGAAHNAQRVLSVQASWFGGWSIAFMFVGLVASIGSIVLVRIWRHRGRRLKASKGAPRITPAS